MRATSCCARWAAPGQAALGRARVLVIGAGGLGAPVLLYLAAAGVGTLGVIDDDVVALSNLQRQVIHTTPDIGAPKVDSAAAMIRRLNPHVAVKQYNTRLTAKNALELIGGYDIVADGSDNFATRYLVSDACYFAKKPLVTAALGTFDGTLTTIRAHERGADGKPNPTYRCLFPEPPPPGTVPACAEAGVLGALAGVIGSMMALEVIREIVGFGENLVGRLVMLDARAMRFETLRYGWDPDNPLSGEATDDPGSVQFTPKFPLPALLVIHAVRPHVGGGGDAVGHVEEAGDGGDIPDVAVGKAGAAHALAILLLDQPRLGGELDGKIEHGALPLRQPRRAIIHRHQFAERRIAGELAHGGAMGDQAIIAAVMRRHRDRDHLAFELAQARRRQHQIVVHGDKGGELGHVEGVGLEHVRHEAELFLAFGEIGRHVGRKRRRRKL